MGGVVAIIILFFPSIFYLSLFFPLFLSFRRLGVTKLPTGKTPLASFWYYMLFLFSSDARFYSFCFMNHSFILSLVPIMQLFGPLIFLILFWYLPFTYFFPLILFPLVTTPSPNFNEHLNLSFLSQVLLYLFKTKSITFSLCVSGYSGLNWTTSTTLPLIISMISRVSHLLTVSLTPWPDRPNLFLSRFLLSPPWVLPIISLRLCHHMHDWIAKC